jgi:hypothetical protein
MRFALLLFLALTLPAKAQQQGSTITLSCDGISKLIAGSDQDHPITNLGIIVDGADRTVTFTDHVTPITGLTATQVTFKGSQSSAPYGVKIDETIDGQIDRVTGYANINFFYGNGMGSTSWELKCRPATRLF